MWKDKNGEGSINPAELSVNLMFACDALRELLEKEGLKHIETKLELLEPNETDKETLELAGKMLTADPKTRSEAVNTINFIHDKYKQWISPDIYRTKYGREYIVKSVCIKEDEHSDEEILKRIKEQVLPACMRNIKKDNVKHFSDVLATKGYGEEKKMYYVRCALMIWIPIGEE